MIEQWGKCVQMLTLAKHLAYLCLYKKNYCVVMLKLASVLWWCCGFSFCILVVHHLWSSSENIRSFKARFQMSFVLFFLLNSFSYQSLPFGVNAIDLRNVDDHNFFCMKMSLEFTSWDNSIFCFLVLISISTFKIFIYSCFSYV